MIVKKCKGCGAVLQDKNELLAGYIPNLTENSTTCKRCYRMIHYNELPKIVAKNEDYERVIDAVTKKKALMIYIVDIFAFQTTFLKKMIDKLRDKDVLLVVNKIDLLPKSTNLECVVDWVSKECQKNHFKVLGIGLASAKKRMYIDELIQVIDLSRRDRDVYFIGCANVGKSSIINALLKHTMNTSNDVIATSMIPGTTLNEIRIPYFMDNCALVDTPGLINNHDILCSSISKESYEKILPKTELKPKTYQITTGNSLFLGGLACLSFDCDEMVPVTVYTSPSLYLHRCKTTRVEDLFSTQLGQLLTPPTLQDKDSVKYKKLTLKIKDKKDIWFSGFGFIQVHKSATITIQVIDTTEVYVTNALIGVC